MGGSRVRQGNFARHAGSVWAQSADASPLSPSDYAFLLERFVDRATLHRAEALAKKWGVLPHAVMIANGWLSASDYYRALAQTCGVPFRDEIGPHEVTAPASLRSPRECLARGLFKERARGGAYVFAPEKLRPNAVEEVLARLAPKRRLRTLFVVMSWHERAQRRQRPRLPLLILERLASLHVRRASLVRGVSCVDCE